jgi:hypothetical protein
MKTARAGTVKLPVPAFFCPGSFTLTFVFLELSALNFVMPARVRDVFFIAKTLRRCE